MEEEQMQLALDLDDQFIVVQDNSLVMGNYDMTAIEQKLLLILLSTIKKDDEELKTISFRVRDLADLMGITPYSLYRDLKKICKSIVGKMVELQNKQGDWIVFNIISYAKYRQSKGVVELKLNNDAKPYVLKLKELFTAFKLEQVLDLESKYAIRIYQITKSNIYKKTFVLELETLKKQLKLTQKSYSLYGNIKKKVIEPALAEINEKTDISLNYEEIKIGRKVEMLKFKVSQKKNNPVKIKPITKSNNKVSESNFKESSFNNFEPRQYDYDKLEKKLLGWE